MATTTAVNITRQARPLRPERIFEKHYSKNHQKRITWLIMVTVGICLIIITFAWSHKQTYTVQLSQYLINANINTNILQLEANESIEARAQQQAIRMHMNRYDEYDEDEYEYEDGFELRDERGDANRSWTKDNVSWIGYWEIERFRNRAEDEEREPWQT
eukprot:139828_1